MTDVSLERGDATLRGTVTGSGPPVLLLHAGGESRGVWRPVAGALARAGYCAVAYDQRGHGESDPAGDDRLPTFAADVVAMVATLHGPPVVVGSSLGGLAALLALADPGLQERVAGLVLVDVVPDPPPRATRSFLHGAPGELEHVPLVEDILGRAATLRAIAARLSLPVLLVRGGGASPISAPDVRRFTALVPHAQVTTVAGAGHLVARDAPAELATELVAFLRARRP